MSGLQKINKQISATSIIITVVLMAGLLLPTNLSQLFIDEAIAGTGGPVPRYGKVLTRGIVRSEAGNPIWAEIGVDGLVVADINEAVGAYKDAKAYSVLSYLSIIEAFNNFKNAHRDGIAKGAVIMTRAEYQQKQFPNVDVPKLNITQDDPNKTESIPIRKLSLRDSTQTVYVRSQESVIEPRLLPEKGAQRGMILFEAPIDIRESELKTEFGSDIKSLLLSDKGAILKESPHNISFKTHFFKLDASGQPTKDLVGPVVGAQIDAGIYSLNFITTSRDTGYYGLTIFIPPCPGFIFTHDYSIWAKVFYTNFDPESSLSLGYYYYRSQDSYHCSNLSALFPGSMLGVALSSIENSISDFNFSHDFYVDLLKFSGVSYLSNDGSKIPFADETVYEYTAPPLDKVAPQKLDLNLDRVSDVAVNASDTRYYDIYLDSQTTNSDGSTKEADLQRVADVAPDFTDQGLLKTISKEDMKETDLYIYRVSNGKIVVKKEGLRDRELNDESVGFFYDLTLPGPLDDLSDGLFKTAAEVAQFQEAIGFPPEMIGRKADFLRPGEEVKIIAINRPTGYIGIVKTVVHTAINGSYNVKIDNLVMRPPNLKVKVERIYTVQSGITKDQKPKYIVGFEGGALTTDTAIEISTEWFDQDGTPLPDELEGYTGRLAKVTGPYSLEGGQINTFPIQTGSKLQVLTFSGDILGTEHLYVHVSGYPEWDNPGIGAGDGPLAFRPKNYVPIKVPVHDEVTTEQLRNLNVYNKIDDKPGLDKVEAVYQWPYRPEMQFSVYDLKQNQLKLRYVDDAENEHFIDLKTIEQVEFTKILNSVSYFDLMYDISDPQGAPLDLLGPPKDLVFAFAEDEILSTVMADGAIRFDNLDHIAGLTSDDFLSIRMFQNNDAENILWEWAFLANIYFVDDGGEKIVAENSFSHPSPVVKVGIGEALDNITAQHISVNSTAGTASVTIEGRIFCDLSDMVENGSADVKEVTILVPRSNTTGGFERVVVPVIDVSNVKLEDYLPLKEEDNVTSLEDMKHPYIGRFSKDINLELTAGDVTVIVEAENAIGNKGYDSFTFDMDTSQGVYNITRVVNNESTDRGLFIPLWLKIEDPAITQKNLDNANIHVFGEKRKVIEHLKEDGLHEYYVDRPFVKVARPLNENVVATNIRVIQDNNTDSLVTYSLPNDYQLPPTKIEMDWSFTAASPINFSKFAAGTTVTTHWFSMYARTGWEIDSAKVKELTGFTWRFSGKDDSNSTVIKKFKKITDPVHGVGFELILDFDKFAMKHPEKRLEITLKKEGKPSTITPAAAPFNVVPLKTIILAIDGFAYESAKAVIKSAPNFKKIFENAVNLNNPALSALPTITWANWPGVFSGNPPSVHGILGNSYFPRESTTDIHRYPVVSGGQRDTSIINTAIDTAQGIGVVRGGSIVDAHALSMNARVLNAKALDALPSNPATSIYDNLAEVLGKNKNDPLKARSIRTFYSRHGDSVKMNDTYFAIGDKNLGHSFQDARIFDNGIQTDGFNSVGTGPQAEEELLVGLEKTDIFSLYFPGPDNAGHGEGDQRGEGAIGDVTNPVSSVALLAGDPNGTEGALGRLLKVIELSGYSNAVLFALAADHGLHQYKNVPEDFVLLTEEMEVLFNSPTDRGGLNMQVWRSPLVGTNLAYNNAQLVYSPNGGLAQFYVRSEGKNWQQSPTTKDIKKVASMLYREAIGHDKKILGDKYPGTQLLEDLKPRTDAPISNGAFGKKPAIFVKYCDEAVDSATDCASPRSNNFMQKFRWVEGVYLKCDLRIIAAQNDTARTSLINSFKTEFLNKTEECSILIAGLEGVAGNWIISGYADDTNKTFNQKQLDNTNDSNSELRNMLGLSIKDQTREKDKLITLAAAITGRLILGDYLDLKISSIENFIIERKKDVPDLKWPAFKARLEEMNHKYISGSRTGDIVTILDGRAGYLAINENHDLYPGWHGGPTVSESYVPLIFGMPGKSFVDLSGNPITAPKGLEKGFNKGRSSVLKQDGYLRNWQLSPILRGIISEFRDE